jgi:UDP-N-acetylglucosamine acyltransferase
MSNEVHETAVVSPGANIGNGVVIGPYSIVGEKVTLGDGVVISSHVTIDGDTSLGDDCRVFPYASIGSKSQDLKDMSEGGKLIIGKGNTFREFVTINSGTPEGGGLTQIGDNNFFMAYTHVAHDCRLGNFIVMANVATLAGHVNIEDHVILGGLVAVHQFVKIGKHAFIGGGTMVQMDIAPFMSATHGIGRGAKLMGPNTIGLERRGFETDAIKALKNAYKIIWRSKKMLEDALSEVESNFGDNEEVRYLIDFIRSSERGIAR